MRRAHQPGSQPIDIPEVIPNPAVLPKPEPAPREPAPKEPVKIPEEVRGRWSPGDPVPTWAVWSNARARRRDRGEAPKKSARLNSLLKCNRAVRLCWCVPCTRSMRGAAPPMGGAMCGMRAV